LLAPIAVSAYIYAECSVASRKDEEPVGYRRCVVVREKRRNRRLIPEIIHTNIRYAYLAVSAYIYAGCSVASRKDEEPVG
jgi:hypothetical protein